MSLRSTSDPGAVWRVLAISAGLMAAGCGGVSAPVMIGGAPFDLSAELKEQVRVRYVWAETTPEALGSHVIMRDPEHGWSQRDWRERDQARGSLDWELTTDVANEVRQELKECAAGERAIDVAVRIETIVYDGADSDETGQDQMVALVEMFEADGTGPIARYRVAGLSPRRFSSEPPYDTPGFSITLNDREDSMAEYLGRALCLKAFGRNPRPSRILNMTD